MYRDVSFFKQHPSLVDEGGNKPEVNRACSYWYGAGDAGGELFRFYSNGKPIIRVHDAMKECGSVHEWNVPSKEFAASATGTNNGQLKRSQYVYHQLMRVEEMGGAVLLHFAVCSFATFEEEAGSTSATPRPTTAWAAAAASTSGLTCSHSRIVGRRPRRSTGAV